MNLARFFMVLGTTVNQSFERPRHPILKHRIFILTSLCRPIVCFLHDALIDFQKLGFQLFQ